MTLQIDETRQSAPERPDVERRPAPRADVAGLTLGERRLLLALSLVIFLLPACALVLGALAGWFTGDRVDFVADAYWQLLAVTWTVSGLLVLQGKRRAVRAGFVVIALSLMIGGHVLTASGPALAQQSSSDGDYTASVHVGGMFGIDTSLVLDVVRPGSLVSYHYPELCQAGFSGDEVAPVITWTGDSSFTVDLGDAGHSTFAVAGDHISSPGWMAC